ncbi:MAG: glycosyltransferase [Spirochaetes bacterium]|nr:glycosyltransferase [Spirochaetota bacterium]
MKVIKKRINYKKKLYSKKFNVIKEKRLNKYYYLNSHSVIIPLKNRFDLTLEAVVSVLLQDVYFIKIILIDDNSKENFYTYFLSNIYKIILYKKKIENYLKLILKRDLFYINIDNIYFYKNDFQLKRLKSKFFAKKIYNLLLLNRYKYLKNKFELGDYKIKYKKTILIKIHNKKQKKLFIRKIVILRHSETFFSGVAKNNGLKFSKSNFISFLDSDDIYLPSRLKLAENFVRKIKNSNEFENINKDTFHFDNLDRDFIILQNKDYYLYDDKLINLNKKHFKIEGNIFLESIKQNRISIPSLTLSKKTLDFIQNFFNEEPFSNLPVMEDYYFFLKITFLFNVFLLDEKLTIIRKWTNVESLTKTYDNFEFYRLQGFYRFIIKILVILDKYKRESRFCNRYLCLYSLISSNKDFILDQIFFKIKCWVIGSIKREKIEMNNIVKFVILVLLLVDFF